MSSDERFSDERFSDQQAQIIFNDVFLEYLKTLTPPQREQVLVEVFSLCVNPVGSHPLSHRNNKDQLAGWNTIVVLQGEHLVVFGTRIKDEVGVIEVLCGRPRRADAVSDMSNLLIATGRLSAEEATEIRQVLLLLDVVAERVGLDGWDFRPPQAPPGMVKAAVAAGILGVEIASALSLNELEAAMESGWTASAPYPTAALQAALRRSRSGIDAVDATRVLSGRSQDRCDTLLSRSKTHCIRRNGHPGSHRSRV